MLGAGSAEVFCDWNAEMNQRERRLAAAGTQSRRFCLKGNCGLVQTMNEADTNYGKPIPQPVRTAGRIQKKLEKSSGLYRNQPESAPALRPSSSSEASWFCNIDFCSSS